MQKILLFLFTFSFSNTMAQNKSMQQKEDDFMEKLLMNNPVFEDIVTNKENYRVQIVYTQINRDKNNRANFKRHTYNLNHNNYFYPASMIKMPTAFLALQKLNELHIKGLNKYTTMLTDSAWKNQSKVFQDTSSSNGKPSIAQYIKKIFLVSDNDANNRLYEFLGQEYLNNNLHKMGYPDAQILHRLSISLSEDENRHTNPIKFEGKNGKIIFEQAAQISKLTYAKRNDFLGKGFYKNDSLINEAFNFSTKNRLYIDDMTDMLLSVIFPDNFPAKKRFNLTKEDYTFLYQCMSRLPKESTHPTYDSTQNYDAFCKYFMYGADKKVTIPKNIRIFNKVGLSYGFLTDVAYIVDFENNIEFALSATIYLNEDGILNDDKYEYEQTGFPFLKNLGQEIYTYELKRERKFKPNLNKFKIKYDK